MDNHTATAERLRYRGQVGSAHAGRIAHFEHETAAICFVVIGFEDFTLISASEANSDASKQEFDRLADKWESETQAFSSDASIKGHEAYQAMKGIGREAIRWIIDRLHPEGAPWFYLLAELAPNPPEIERGNVRQIILAWKKWGRDNGYRP